MAHGATHVMPIDCDVVVPAGYAARVVQVLRGFPSRAVVPVLALNGETASNFTVTPQNGSWSITPAPVTMTAGSYSGVYDGAAHAPTDCAVTGTYKGALTCTNNPALVGPNVGSGTVAPVLELNGETATNFTVTPVNGAWSITAATATATYTSFGWYSTLSPTDRNFKVLLSATVSGIGDIRTVNMNASSNAIGGTVAGAGNLISGNLNRGITLDGANNLAANLDPRLRHPLNHGSHAGSPASFLSRARLTRSISSPSSPFGVSRTIGTWTNRAS